MPVNRQTANNQEMEILIDFFFKTRRSTEFEEQPTRQTELFFGIDTVASKNCSGKITAASGSEAAFCGGASDGVSSPEPSSC